MVRLVPIPKEFYRGASPRQVQQRILVEPAAGDDLDRLEPALVEDPANLPRVFAEVAAVDTYTRDGDALRRQARRKRYHPSRGAFGIIGIDQEDEALRMRMGEVLEGESSRHHAPG